MTNTANHCKLYIPVVFNYGLKSAFTLDTGSVVEWEPEDGNLIRIYARETSHVISTDDASPVAWDSGEQAWVEA